MLHKKRSPCVLGRIDSKYFRKSMGMKWMKGSKVQRRVHSECKINY